MIKAAQTRAQISQIDKYNTAVETFYGKYGGIPGDLSSTLASQFGFTVGNNCNGYPASRDGNGYVDGGAPIILYSLGQLNGETGIFWSDLSTAGYIDGNFPNGGQPYTACTGVTPAVTLTSIPTFKNYMPEAKIGYGNFVYVYEADGFNWFGITAFTNLNTGGIVTGEATSIPVLAAYNMDKKVDDGLPVTGSVQAVYIGLNNIADVADAPNANPDTSSTCYNSSTLQYSISQNGGTGPNCALSFRMISPGR